MKICTKCENSLEDKQFPFKNKAKGIRSTICSNCQKQYKIDYYNRNREDFYKRNKNKEEKLKQIIRERKDFCIVCKESEKVCLDFHHLGNKDFNISGSYKRGSFTKLVKELNKCIILCANCHRKVHAGIIDANVV